MILDRIWYGAFSIWCLGYLTYVAINLNDYGVDHGRTLLAFWALLSFLSIKRYVKNERTHRKEKNDDK